MDIEEMDRKYQEEKHKNKENNNNTVKVGNEDKREVILSRYIFKISFQGGDQGIMVYIQK